MVAECLVLVGNARDLICSANDLRPRDMVYRCAPIPIHSCTIGRATFVRPLSLCTVFRPV